MSSHQAIAGSRSPAMRSALRALRVAASWLEVQRALPPDLPALRGQCEALALVCKRRALLRSLDLPPAA